MTTWTMTKYLVLVCFLLDLSLAEEAGVLPNIIFMMADDLGFGDVRYNGGIPDTPNLDAMAQGPNSVQLNRYYSGGCTCSPTRGSVLTGRNPNRYCIWHANRLQGCHDFACSMLMPLPTSEITVAEILQEHGYRTAAFGKWHIGDFHPCPYQYSNKKWPVAHPGVHGFDTWWVTMGICPTVTPNCGCFAHAHCESGHYGYTRVNSRCRNYYTIDDDTGELKSYPDPIPGDDSHFLYQLLHQFLDNVTSSGKPFFVYLPFHTVHGPYIALPELLQRYTSRGHNLNEADYYGSITTMDEVVGQIRQLLDQYGVRRNTMLWFTSDNGPARDYPGSTGGFRGRKGSLWEGGVRVPGIIEWPAVISNNLQSDFPVVSSDLLPTVCDILGISPPLDREIDGESILPFLQGRTSLRNKSIGWAWYVHETFEKPFNITYSGNQYKIFVFQYDAKKNEMMKTELFDLVNDPHETTDVSGDHPELLASMKQEALEWIRSVMHSATEEVQCVGYSMSSKCHGCCEDFDFMPVCDPK